MKYILLLALFLPSCESIPVAASYTGHLAGHEFTAGYSKETGAVLAVAQK